MDREQVKPWKTAKFWEDLGERAVMTAAQSAISTIGVDGMVDAFALDWRAIGGIAVGAAVLSVAKSLAAGLKGNPESASLVQ